MLTYKRTKDLGNNRKLILSLLVWSIFFDINGNIDIVVEVLKNDDKKLNLPCFCSTSGDDQKSYIATN
jgi:hypothetical protein